MQYDLDLVQKVWRGGEITKSSGKHFWQAAYEA